MIKIWNYTIIFIIVILMFNMVYGIPVYHIVSRCHVIMSVYSK